MKSLEEIKKVLERHKEILQQRYGISKIGIFGSFARNEAMEISDVDIIVEFKQPIGLKFIELADYLEELLGVKVDLLTEKSVKQKPLLWQSIKEDIVYV